MRRSDLRFRDFSLGCARKAFDPFLMIGVEGAGMLATELVEEPGALLGFLGQHMAAIARRGDDPTMVCA